MSDSCDDLCCYSTDASSHSVLSSISSDDDMNPSLSTSSDGSWPSSPTISISEDNDAKFMDNDENDGDDDSSNTSDTSTPLDETMDEMDDTSEDDSNVVSLTDGINDGDDIIELSDDDDDDIADPKKDTVARSQPPTTFNRPMFSAFSTSTCSEEEIVARSHPSAWTTFNRPMSILSAFSLASSTCTEEEIVTPSCSSESNGEKNFSSSSIKKFLPPNRNTYKLCFDNGVEVDRILEVVCHNKEILFRIRWRKDKNGGTDYVNAFEIYHKCPNMALQFYKEHFKVKNTDKADKKLS